MITTGKLSVAECQTVEEATWSTADSRSLHRIKARNDSSKQQDFNALQSTIIMMEQFWKQLLRKLFSVMM